MEALVKALPWVVVGLMLLIALLALRRPLQWVGRLLARTGVGLAALYALSGFLGLGVNLANALVLGLLGVPGFGLLLMMNWVLAV